jgi:plasmid replication initiation protein
MEFGLVAGNKGARDRGQLDLFVAFVGDVPLRDEREGMSIPLVSLSKNKRTVPIEWKSSDGERWVQVTANATHGMATIWDVDVLIWAVSQINAAVEAGRYLLTKRAGDKLTFRDRRAAESRDFLGSGVSSVSRRTHARHLSCPDGWRMA